MTANIKGIGYERDYLAMEASAMLAGVKGTMGKQSDRIARLTP